jgi:hypothetical protein
MKLRKITQPNLKKRDIPNIEIPARKQEYEI